MTPLPRNQLFFQHVYQTSFSMECMATNIPPHNLGELIDALTFLLHHPSPETVSIEELVEFVQGPDFPTGGIIYNKKDIIEAYTRGRGSVIMRGRVGIEE